MDTNSLETLSADSGKRDSFYGDRSIVISAKLLHKIKENVLINSLYITDMGFYPFAKNHFRKRIEGIPEQILIYCVDGSGTICANDIHHQLTANTCFFIPAHQPHAYWADSNTPWSIYWIHFGGERSRCFEDFYSRIISIPPCSSSRIDERIKLFNEILNSLESGFSNENIEFANLCLNSLLATFFYVESYRTAKGYLSKDPVDQAIFYMQSNLRASLRLKDIAGHVHLSGSHFSRVFRNKTGSSPIDYFINLKMQEAIRLLTNKNLRIKEVAFAIGYDDPFYFSRIFTRHFGSSPGAFVKTTRNNPV
jgi:AraC family transcriptional regulator, arabinose operon regulatory protein